MNSLTDQIFTLLTVPPGNTIYHIPLVFFIAGAALFAFNNWRSSEFPQARRALIGLSSLLALQILLFVISGFGWQGLIDSNSSLPPIDRAFNLLTIVCIAWLWAFPEPNRMADMGALLLVMLVGIAMILGIFHWAPQVSLITYNQTIDELLWQVASLVFISLGIFVLFVRKPDSQWLGVAFLALAFLGHAGHLIYTMDGNYSGIVRLAYMAAYPILFTLPQRFPAVANASVSRPSRPSVRREADKDTGRPEERRRYSTDPKTFHAMLALAAETQSTKVSQAITRAVAQTMLSDLCFLIYLTDNNTQTVIAGGYDLIREESMEGGSLNKTAAPMVVNAVQRGKPLRLPQSSTSADIKGLGNLLGIDKVGDVLCVPIVTPEKDSLGGVLLLSPYSERPWNAEDQTFLSTIATSLVPIIQRSQYISRLEQKSEQASAIREQAIAQVDELERRNRELANTIETMKAEAASQPAAPSADMSALIAMQEETQRALEKLKKENDELRLKVKADEMVTNNPQVERELRDTLKEMARLQNQLIESNMKIDALEKEQAGGKSAEQAEVIASISQELRQPMSSINGYTELLLGESVGILGALQRKFVEKIKASTERMRTLVEDMVRLATTETGALDIKIEMVDINKIIDTAMSYTSSQIREKNISIQFEIPKRISNIKADREALQQILIHLLQNAGAASPIEGMVKLRVESRSEDGDEYILIQVTDSGGGIPAEDLPRVFSRLYRADNVLIQGIGDTGVGLSIAKTMTEAQHGRIWVESEAGVGATFSVLLPVNTDSPERFSAKARGRK